MPSSFGENCESASNSLCEMHGYSSNISTRTFCPICASVCTSPLTNNGHVDSHNSIGLRQPTPIELQLHSHRAHGNSARKVATVNSAMIGRSNLNALRSTSLSTEHLDQPILFEVCARSPANVASSRHNSLDSNLLRPSLVQTTNVCRCKCTERRVDGQILDQISPRALKATRLPESSSINNQRENQLCFAGKKPESRSLPSSQTDPPLNSINSNCLIMYGLCNEQGDIDEVQIARSDLPNLSYELREDLRAKEIELTERCYGGRMRAQRAARIIQNTYRDYRMRMEYARIKQERSSGCKSAGNTPVQVSGTQLKIVLPRSNDILYDSCSPRSLSNEQSKLKPSGSVEDMVLEQAYVDWALQAATAQSNCNQLPNSDIAKTAEDGTTELVPPAVSSSAGPPCPVATGQNGVTPSRVAHSIGTNVSCANSLDLTSSTDSFQKQGVGSELCCGFYPVLVKEPPLESSVCNCGSRSFPNPFSCELQRRRTSPVRKLSSPTSIRRNFSDQSSTNPSVCFYQRTGPGIVSIVPVSIHSSPSSISSASHCTCMSYKDDSTNIANKMAHLLTHPSGHRQKYYCHCGADLIRRSRTQPPQLLLSNGQQTSLNSGPVLNLNHRILSAGGNPEEVILTDAVHFKTEAHSLQCTSKSTAQVQTTSPRGPLLVTMASSNLNHQNHFPAHATIPSVAGPHQLTRLGDQKMPNRILITPVHCQVHPCHPLPGDQQHRRQHQQASLCQLQHLPSHVTKYQAPSLEKRRKRVYRIGLNIVNKSPLKGIDFLIRCGFLDCSPETIARFLLNRKGLSRVAIGDYLGNTKDELAMATTRQFMRELDFRELEVDEALRLLLSCFRTPGESQKIVHLLTEFQSAYVEQNPARVKAQFRNADSVMVLAYAIVMLHTDMYSPNVRPQVKMTREEFVRNLRGVDAGEDLNRNLLLAIYDRIQLREMSVAPDHTDQVRKIQQHLTGPLRPLNLALPHRRLVCYCRLYEVPDKNKRERPGAHQREVFLFNDLLLITKAVQKKRRDAAIAYQVRVSLNLLGVRLSTFETANHPHGLELLFPLTSSNVPFSPKESGLSGNVLTPDGRARVLVALNTKTLSDRARFMEDLLECILEVTEMDRLRTEEEFGREVQQRRRVSRQSNAATNTTPPPSGTSPHVRGLSRVGKTESDHRSVGSDQCGSGVRWNKPETSDHTNLSAPRVPLHTSSSFGVVPSVPAPSIAHDASGHKFSADGESLRTQSSSSFSRGQQNSCIRPDSLGAKQFNSAGEVQRLSGDSGLLADLETPTSQTSHILGSSNSDSPS
ncbi:unnamed protein product [Calicophoron daubneyi]|uniref:SEC7 domain-containing protein n=1 Tax=Calicophoron daubneyi TaxID=300641 RepID=A0AAV2TWA5_CALDB